MAEGNSGRVVDPRGVQHRESLALAPRPSLARLQEGPVLFYDNTMTDQAVNNGDTAQFPIGDLDIQMT